MTKLNHTRQKLGRTTRPNTEWKSRNSAEIRRDLKIISDAWEGTAEDRRAYGMLKGQLRVALLEEARLRDRK